MSRYCFSKIISNTSGTSGAKDLLGYELADWISNGIVGFDAPLNTYFMNMEGSWIFGTTVREIPSIHHLQRMIAAIFPTTLVPFCEEGLREIAVGVETFLSILTPEQAAAESALVSREYLNKQIEIAKFYRDQ